MGKQSAAEKKLDKEIERAYYQHGQGVAINIMDIGKVFADCRAAVLAGGSLDEAVKTAIAKYRQN